MAEVFYRKWRPQKLSDVVGQEPITRTLLNALITGRVAHAYLFFGPRGTGKTSTGRILAKAVNCLQSDAGEPCNTCAICQTYMEGRALDLIEIDAASNTGVDDIRDLKEKVNFAPAIAHYKVYIIDEVHMLSNSAFNALLKTLEEPPVHVIFILATTEVHKVPATITSRCQRFDFRRISQSAMIKRLEHICHEECIMAEPQVLALIAKSATGSLRDAENLLEQMVVYHGPHIDIQQARAELGLIGDARIKELSRSILTGDISTGLSIINGAADDGLDLRQFNRELVSYFREMLLIKAGVGDATGLSPEELAEAKDMAGEVTLQAVTKAIKLFNQADFRFSPQSALPLELALVDYGLSLSEGKHMPDVVVQGKKTMDEVHSTTAVKQKVATTQMPEDPSCRDSSGIGHIQQHWNDFVKACRGTPGNIDALLRGSCEPVSLEDNTLVLGFYSKSGFQKSKVEEAKYSQVLEEKIEKVFGTRYRVQCILIGNENRPAPPPVEEIPLVKEALAHGAEIINKEYVR